MSDAAVTLPGTGQNVATLALGNQHFQQIVAGGAEYETVAASQTAQVLGPTGATGDYLNFVLVVPATTSPGSVAVLDSGTSITVFTGGATSVSNLVPFAIPIMAASVNGSWRVTTGADVSVVAFGKFT